MKILDIFLERPRVLFLSLAFILLAGISSALSLPVQENPELAEAVKKYRITFESIFEIFPDNLLRDLMNAVDLDGIAMALKGMDKSINDKVIGVLPKKKQAMFTPKMSRKLRNNLLQGWQQAIRKTLA